MLKGQCHDIFDTFYIKKTCELAKTVSWIFRFCKDILKKNLFPRCRWLRGHDNDNADTFGKLWRLLTDFKGTLRWKKVNTPNRNNFIIWKTPYLLPKEKYACPTVTLDFSNFANKYLCENEQVRETVLPVHMGAMLNLLSKKIMVQNIVTLSRLEMR